MRFSLDLPGRRWVICLALPSFAAMAADQHPPGAYVIVARAVQGCFFDTVRVSGYVVPRQEVQVPFEAEGFRITEVSVSEGDKVTSGQQLAKLVRLSGDQPANLPSPSPQPIIVKSPVTGTVIKTSASVGSLASPRAEPLFRIAVDGQLELEAEVP